MAHSIVVSHLWEGVPIATAAYLVGVTGIEPGTKILDSRPGRRMLLVNATQPGGSQDLTVYVGGPPGVGFAIQMFDTPLHPRIYYFNQYLWKDSLGICEGEVWASQIFPFSAGIYLIETWCPCGQPDSTPLIFE